MHRQYALNTFPNLAEGKENEETRCQGEDVRTQSMKEWSSKEKIHVCTDDVIGIRVVGQGFGR